ncbi:Ig-like domain-containing protein [Mucilaginibacter sp. Bleaf8]|uniref:Ig-like domain-containing protein n=1 Tax=Mucilaginibacter sp. Bleaf8 TaxID=2834430 RepID=UPI001BD11B7B|nr:Ig-like domain-containing protein [Mucilaginibacter sp. Bleaf8]MBS7565612.1 Ig-like domain-containing protein [Mucilaginibacter sp. Bleaf8]
MGGPRDRTPPKLLKATPANMTRNFAAKEIKLDFDEYFKLSNAYQEISVSPAFEKSPEYNTKGRSLVISLKDTLLKNTTYVFNFGKAIADVNESNVMKNFTYVFSTGNVIDSLSISGSVTNTLNSEKEKDATVMIFPIERDSALFGKKKPSIYTTTDSAGNFSLNNLHEGRYTIYALKEASPDKVYNNDNELIAFSKRTINLKSDTSNVQLNLFKQTPEKFRVSTKRIDPDGKVFLGFNKPLVDPNIKINYPAAVDAGKIIDYNKNRDTASIYLRNMDFDSLSVVISDQNKPLDTVFVKKGRNETFKRNLTFRYNINNDNKLAPGTDVEITASLPIEAFDLSKIRLLEDSAAVNPISLLKDTKDIRRFILKHRWRQNTRYELVFSDEAMTSIYGDKNKELNKRFQIDKPENYGSLTIKYSVPDTAKSYIIELMNSKKEIIRKDVVSKTTSLVYKALYTGKYRVKVTYDANRNGRFDTGSVKQKQFPENVWFSDKELTLRPNWDQEETVEIPKEPATP